MECSTFNSRYLISQGTEYIHLRNRVSDISNYYYNYLHWYTTKLTFVKSLIVLGSDI